MDASAAVVAPPPALDGCSMMVKVGLKHKGQENRRGQKAGRMLARQEGKTLHVSKGLMVVV